MSGAPRSFDRLARPYRMLEFIAFGSTLEQVRFHFLDQLRDCGAILVLGEGDGRCLARLVRLAPDARFTCVDFSGAMLARARARLTPADAARVDFVHADALGGEFPPGDFDGVVTLFFLDCFTPAQTAGLIGRIVARLRPGARWLWADFQIPAGGPARWRAQLWLKILYGFFRWQTALPARALPPAEELLQSAGLVLVAGRDFEGGLLRSALYRLPGPLPVTVA